MNIESYKTIGTKVLIRAYEWPEKIGNIWLPDMVKYSETKGGKDPWRGLVLKIGKDVTQVKEGEIVRYQPDNYSRQTLTIEGKRYIALDELLIYSIEDENENILRACKNRIVFLADPIIETQYGRIYLPSTREEKLLYGTIVAAGPETQCQPGDRVVMENKSTWQYFNSGGKRYIMTDRFNVLAKVKDV